MPDEIEVKAEGNLLTEDKNTLKLNRSSICEPKEILQAVSILRKLNEKHYTSAEKKPLLDDTAEKAVFLQVTMKKIPPQRLQKYIKVRLPNSFASDTSEICLITGDLDKRNRKAEIEPDVLHYKELLRKEGITQVNEVMTLRQLRTEFKPYEAKQALAAAYDFFLCDKKIAGVLPRLLGKNFIQNRKLPIQINMKSSNLKQQVENALSSTVFHVTCRGSSCASEVANLSMNDEHIINNIKSAVTLLSEEIPGKLENISGLYVKLDRSKAIPIYMSLGNPNEVVLETRAPREEIEAEELSTIPNTKVIVLPNGRVIVKRIIEDDDSEKNEDSDDNANESEADNKVLRKSKKKSKSKKIKISNPELVEKNKKTEETEENYETKNKDLNKAKRKSISKKAKIESNGTESAEQNENKNRAKKTVVNKSIRKSMSKKANIETENLELIEENDWASGEKIETEKEADNKMINKSKRKSMSKKSIIETSNSELVKKDVTEEVDNKTVNKRKSISKKVKIDTKNLELVDKNDETEKAENKVVNKLTRKSMSKKVNIETNDPESVEENETVEMEETEKEVLNKSKRKSMSKVKFETKNSKLVEENEKMAPDAKIKVGNIFKRKSMSMKVKTDIQDSELIEEKTNGTVEMEAKNKALNKLKRKSMSKEVKIKTSDPELLEKNETVIREETDKKVPNKSKRKSVSKVKIETKNSELVEENESAYGPIAKLINTVKRKSMSKKFKIDRQDSELTEEKEAENETTEMEEAEKKVNKSKQKAIRFESGNSEIFVGNENAPEAKNKVGNTPKRKSMSIKAKTDIQDSDLMYEKSNKTVEIEAEERVANKSIRKSIKFEAEYSELLEGNEKAPEAEKKVVSKPKRKSIKFKADNLELFEGKEKAPEAKKKVANTLKRKSMYVKVKTDLQDSELFEEKTNGIVEMEAGNKSLHKSKRKSMPAKLRN